MTELQQRFLTAVDIIDSLYKFSRMIRTPSLHARVLKAAFYTKIDRETGVDLIAQYKTVDFAYVREGFLSFRRENGEPAPSVSQEDTEPIRHFASGITKRRQLFLYWKRHRDKLGVHERADDFDVGTVLAPETVHSAGDAPPESSQGKTQLTGTSATIFIAPKDGSEAGQTVTSFAETARGLDGTRVELPALPISAVPGKDFECQYCFAIVPSKYQSTRGWR